MLALIINVLLLLSDGIIADQCPPGSPVMPLEELPGLFSIGRGFDIVTGLDTLNMFENIADVNNSTPLNVSCQMYVRPAHVLAIQDAAPSVSSKGICQFFSTAKEIAIYRANEAGIDGKYFASLNATIQWFNEANTLIETEQVLVQQTTDVLEYTLEMQDFPVSQRTMTFHDAVARLNVSDPTTFDDLIAKFGTHYTHRVEVGGRYVTNVAIDSCVFKSEDVTTVQHVITTAIDAGGIKSIAAAAGSDPITTDKLVPDDTNVELHFNGTNVPVNRTAAAYFINAATSTEVKGGDPLVADLSEWIKTVNKLPPATFSRALRSIDVLFQGEERQAMLAALGRKLGTTMPPSNINSPSVLGPSTAADLAKTCEISDAARNQIVAFNVVIVVVVGVVMSCL